ncbi:MAG: HlyD family secretion protein [Paludibacteraceae bacterium]
MPRPIFPPEILDSTVEVYHARIHTRSKIIYGLILCLVLGAVVALPLVKVDVTMQSRGVTRSPMENTVVQAGVYGEAVRYAMAENKPVRRGDTLLVLQTRKLSEQQALSTGKIGENNRFIADIDRQQQDRRPLHTSNYAAEYTRYTARLSELQTTVGYLKKQLDADTDLRNNRVISEFDYLKTKNSYDAAAEQLHTARQEFSNTWQAERTTLLLQNKELASGIDQLEQEKREYVVTAPVSGTLVQVAGFGTGNFIAPAQPLAYISASDSLIAECYVSPADIGYVYVGQPVNFQFDAFNYREWGMLKGTVTEIVHDVVAIDQKPAFRVRCAMQGNTLHLKNGYTGTVQKGLSYTARFLITRRTLWQLLFDKVDNWLNPKLNNPATTI